MLRTSDSEKNRLATPQQMSSDASSLRLAEIEKSLIDASNTYAESLDGLFDFEEQLYDPPPAVANFIKKFAEEEEAEADRYSLTKQDRRREARVACSRAVIAIPVDRQFVQVDEPFKAAIRDVSANGIRLLDTRASNTRFLALSWQTEALHGSRIGVVMEVLKCKVKGTFYSISGKFVFAD